MFDSLLQWDIVQKVLFNTILVSIPEELFLTMFTLILVGEFEYWKEEECKKLINEWDYSRIFIPTVVSALLSNILRYGGVGYGIGTVVSLLSLFVLIILTNHIFGDASALKWVGKAFAFLLLAMVVLFITEFIYTPLIMYGTGKELDQINHDILLNFTLSLPSRLIQYSIIMFFIVKKRTLLQARVMKIIFGNRVYSIITLFTLVLNVSFCIINFSVFSYRDVLAEIPLAVCATIIVGICVFPVLNISTLVWGIYYAENRAALKQKAASEQLGKLVNEIKTYTFSEEYDNIKWKLNHISACIEGVSNELYKIN